MSEPRPIAAIVKREQRRLWRQSPGLGLQCLWEEVAGPEVSAHTRVRSLRDGVMTVECSSGGWACELKLHATDLTEKINARKPPEPVAETRFIPAARGNRKSRK